MKGPRTLNHFWPRLWLTAKPLGTEARKAKSDNVLPGLSRAVEHTVHSRIFVQGGNWISEHVHNLSALECQMTCVLLMEGSKLYDKVGPQHSRPKIKQGVLQSICKDRSKCKLSFFKESVADTEEAEGEEDNYRWRGPPELESTVTAALTDEDLWWCLPYWVAADYKLHFEKIPVEHGFYFLAQPGQAFCIVVVNWSGEDIYVNPKVDGRRVSEACWFLLKDDPPLVFRMFEEDEVGQVLRGEQLTFTRRGTCEQLDKDWQKELALSGAVIVNIYRVMGPDETGPEVAFSDEEGGKEAPDDPSSPEADESRRRTSGAESSAVVKKDSKWAMHLSVASAPGKEVEEDSGYIPGLGVGEKLGSNVLHFRGPEWFKTIDLMLQEESMRAERLKRNGSIFVGEGSLEGATKDRAICLDDSPAPARAEPARPAEPAEQALVGPIRNSKALRVSFHEGGRGTPVSHVVQVPKSHNVATFKSTVKEALADEDVFGEEIRTARLKWTYVEDAGDRCEVDISPFTEAAELESSGALHVYLLPTKR